MPIISIRTGANLLPRGGYLVGTSAGYVQFGAPPETIKDTMSLPKQVPKIFVLPGELFNVEKGISVAELEFPIYFNHFLKGRKTYILCTEKQRSQLLSVLQESVFGPESLDLRSEYPDGGKSFGFPNMKAEIDHFRGDRKIEDLVTFGIFKNNKIKINDITIHREEGKNFKIYDKEKPLAEVPWTIEYKIKYDIGERLKEPFDPPELGITCLGPSHGFDPEDNTSGFILWINKHGIMVDPPVNSTEWLRDSNVNPRFIRHVILTHCHADHDAGTFQKIIEDAPVTIHTTETVMDSFIRKYYSMTKISKSRLLELFEFNPVQMDTPVFIEGAQFIFHYSLHSIPSLGFRFMFRNRSFFYTSDHLNHPETFDKLKNKEVLTEERCKFLKNFPWNTDIIYHEAGIPPLHTPISYLASLPEEIQKKITVYHIAKKDFPHESKLNLATFGMENTLYPDIAPPRFPKAYEILDVMSNLDLFTDFNISKAKEFLTIVEEEKFNRGDYIIQKGTEGDKFYIIVSGNIRVEGTSTGISKTYGSYEYFGEASLITGEPRSADVVAETEVFALTIEKNLFLNFIRGTILEQNFRHLAEIRQSNSWTVLSSSKIFGAMTSTQKTNLETILSQTKAKKGTTLFDEKKPAEFAYIMISGEVELKRNGQSLMKLTEGDFVGEIFSLQKSIPTPFKAQVTVNAELFKIKPGELTDFIKKNPGIYMRLMSTTIELLG